MIRPMGASSPLPPEWTVPSKLFMAVVVVSLSLLLAGCNHPWAGEYPPGWPAGWSVPQPVGRTYAASGAAAFALDPRGEVHHLTVSRRVEDDGFDLRLNDSTIVSMVDPPGHLNMTVSQEDASLHLSWIQREEGTRYYQIAYLRLKEADASDIDDPRIIRSAQRPIRDLHMIMPREGELLFTWVDMTAGRPRVFAAGMSTAEEQGRRTELEAVRLTGEKGLSGSDSDPTIIRDQSGITHLWWIREGPLRNHLMYWSYDGNMDPMSGEPAELGTVSGTGRGQLAALHTAGEVFAVWPGAVLLRASVAASGILLGRFTGGIPDGEPLAVSEPVARSVRVFSPSITTHPEGHSDQLFVAWSNSDRAEQGGQLVLYVAGVDPVENRVSGLGPATLEAGEAMWPTILAAAAGEDLTLKVFYHVPVDHETLEIWRVTDAEPAQPGLAFYLGLCPRGPWADALFKLAALVMAGAGLTVARALVVVVATAFLMILSRTRAFPAGRGGGVITYLLAAAIVFSLNMPGNPIYWQAAPLPHPWDWAVFAAAAGMTIAVLRFTQRSHRDTLNWLLAGFMFVYIDSALSVLYQGSRLHLLMPEAPPSHYGQKLVLIVLLLVAGWLTGDRTQNEGG